MRLDQLLSRRQLARKEKGRTWRPSLRTTLSDYGFFAGGGGLSPLVSVFSVVVVSVVLGVVSVFCSVVVVVEPFGVVTVVSVFVPVVSPAHPKATRPRMQTAAKCISDFITSVPLSKWRIGGHQPIQGIEPALSACIPG